MPKIFLKLSALSKLSESTGEISFFTSNSRLISDQVTDSNGNTIVSFNKEFNGTIVVTSNRFTVIGTNACLSCNCTHVDLSRSSITEIGQSAFFATRNLVSITLPSCLTTVRENAFAYTNLESISFGPNVKNMDGYALNQAPNLIYITVDSNNPYFCSINNYILSKNKDILYKAPNNFEYNKIPNKDSIYKFGQFTIAGSYVREFVGWPNLRELSYASFHAALKLKTVDIYMTSIKEIPSRCFWNSFELDKILLPPSITKIVAGSFESLHKIRSLYIPTNVTAIEDKAFFDLPKLYILAYFGESNFANRGLFQNCSILQNVRVIPSYPSTLFGSVKVVRIA